MEDVDMKIQIVGDGKFGSFLKFILAGEFEVVDDADSVILAVPLQAYKEVASKYRSRHLINVCSVQEPTMTMCLTHSDRVTGIHPLFGPRTPKDKWNSILTYSYVNAMVDNDTWSTPSNEAEIEFLKLFGKISNVMNRDPRTDNLRDMMWTPTSHDQFMAKTHLAAMMAAKQLKVYVDRVQNVPDEFLPNSFRLMKDFVKTLEDMPSGTVQSIMANPYY